ncbi:hypothetical protein C2E21_9125 [Chlorella sorokiniana]|uniref:Uncharacterized protein n=1 Tax=Chlorella sorokiniana TaxID=3076 RepID=A0A2P6TC40_CHLSO|nr:hypothetical protein C2E21_9125 [Chlorella sorokiniana]|eukprot:PRW20201.1 hypothetical protein C2E21_9125 [Chlorella sorokiniana]
MANWAKLGARLRAWRDDSRRTEANRARAAGDIAGFQGAVLLHGSLLLFKVAWLGGQPGLALRCSAYVLLCLAVVLLVRRHPELHARYRELIGTVCGATLAWMMLQLTVHRGLDLFKLHRGSSLALLGALLLSSPAAWLFMNIMFGQSPTAFLRFSLPLLALQPLWQSKRVCQCLLEEAGVQAPLRTLYDALDAVHCIALPAPLIYSPATAPPPNDLAACLAIDWWAVAFVAVVLPLTLLAHMEKGRARQQAVGWPQQQQQQQQHHHYHHHQEQQPGSTRELLLCIYLYSGLVWLLTVQLGPLVWRLLPPLA